MTDFRLISGDVGERQELGSHTRPNNAGSLVRLLIVAIISARPRVNRMEMNFYKLAGHGKQCCPSGHINLALRRDQKTTGSLK